MKNSLFSAIKLPKRLLALVLTLIMVLSAAVIPGGITVSAASYLDEKIYDFEENSGTVYGSGATANDSKGITRTVSGAGFSWAHDISDGVLSLTDTRGARNARDTYFVFNDNSGIYELKTNASYTVSFRFRVVSKQVSFKYNGYTYPTSSQKTFVKLAYGLNSKTEIGDIALITTGGDTFTRVAEDGSTVSLPIGEWHELSFEFATPATFADGENFLLLNAKTFNGVNIEFDDVSVSRIPSVKLVTTKGTLDNTIIPVKIGDKFDLPNPKLAKSTTDYANFGTDFKGWFTDSACTKPFTDKYVTEENCDITLYAGFSNEVFGFESYSRVSKYNAPNHFFSLVENPEEAYSGRGFMHYHYTEEYWSQPYGDGTSLQQSRREASENNISVKKVKPSTSYVISFKYRFLEGSGSINVSIGRAGTNIWWSQGFFTLAEKKTFVNDNSGEWKEYRATFTTPESLKGGEGNWTTCDILYVMLHATDDRYTEVYVDEVVVKEIEENTEIKLVANGGTFDGGKTTVTQKATLGDDIASFPFPTRDEYDFYGWAFDKNGSEMVTAQTVDASVYDNTLYAVWSRNMGFEGYYYDLESPDRNNYVSDTVSIVKENAKRGFYSAKLTSNGGAQNVIAMNPINNKTRYLVTFYYDLKSAAGDVKVQFASMNYNINDNSEVKKYGATYTISKDDAGKGYKMGAVIIDTDFLKVNADRLAMLISGTSGDYTVYFDSIELRTLTVSDGYVLLADTFTGDYKVVIGKVGEKINPEIAVADSNKFIGWYNDSQLTSIYKNDKTFTRDYSVIYAGFIGGEGYDNYTVNGTNTAVAFEKGNKYLKLSKTASEKIYSTTASKRYAVEFSYRVDAITADTTVTVGNKAINLTTANVSKNWQKYHMVITADSAALNLSVNGNDSFVLCIDNVIVYEIADNMTVITFDQKDGYGEDTVRVGVKGIEIAMPSVSGVGNYVFYGWYEDTALKTPFVSKVYPENDITVYGRWATNPRTTINFNDFDQSVYFTENNTSNAYLTGSSDYDLCLDLISEEVGYENYAPLVNKDGYYKLQSNTTYAVKFDFLIKSYTSGATMTINFFNSSSDKFTKGNALGASTELKYAYAFRSYYAYFTTGDLAEGEDALYIYVQKGTKKSTLLLDNVVITRVDEGRNHVIGVDPYNVAAIYEASGNYGAEIDYPNINNKNYVVEGWYNDFETTDCHTSNLHKEEPVTVLHIRWDIKTIDFENYLYENGNRYTVGDDISLSAEEQYDTVRSLKYDYKYAIKYFETSNNTAGLGRVNDDSTYKITFRYKITAAQGDVDIKFLTAHQTNRWAFITNYNEATYRIYSSEIGNGWQEAIVYLTTDFYSIGTSGLFMTFNPVVEGETTVYIDAVNVKTVREPAILAFIGKDGSGVHYVSGNVGDTVNVSDVIPASQFASFNGWFNDKECTQNISGATLGEGINYVYSDWTEKAESFDNYTYASKDGNNFAQNTVVGNGEITVNSAENGLNGLRIGKLNNNTTYKVTFKYKTNAATTVKFATADEMSFYKNNTSYNDEGNFFEAVADGKENTATVYLTTAFTYSVPKDNNMNAAKNKNAEFGDMLYMYFDNKAGDSVTVTDVAVEEIEAVASLGTSVLTEEASKQAGKQALRFYFSYKTDNIVNTTIDGKEFAVIERGIIFKNARNTATGEMNGDMVTVKPIILENKDDKGFTAISKTNGFNQYWTYDNKTESLVFSGYVKDFALKDARLMGARGYIKVKDADGNIYTFYSADKKTTVKAGVEANSEITDTKVHTFGGETFDKFTIVHPKLMPYIYGRQIEFLMEYLKETHKTDLVRVTEKAKETDFEIVIGDTKRAASDLVTVENEDQYVIAVRGTKLIIKGGSDLAVMQGVKDFIDYLKMKDSLGCGADLKDGYTKYGLVSKTMDDYKLTFNDDFDGATLDTSKWGAYTSQSKAKGYKTESNLGGYCYTYSVGEGGYTTATGRVVENAVGVRDGNAVLTTGRLNETDFTKGEISTFWQFMYQYGYFEVNCKLSEPPSHVGWWVNGANIPASYPREARGCMTEYDLIENYGRMNYYATAIHNWWGSNSIKDTGHISIPDSYGIGESANYYVPDDDETSMYDNYHILTFLWENDRLVFALDGIKYYEYVNYEYYKERMANYIILSQGMGNRDYGVKYEIDKHNDYYETLIDYVRIYQNEAMGSRIVKAQK